MTECREPTPEEIAELAAPLERDRQAILAGRHLLQADINQAERCRVTCGRCGQVWTDELSPEDWERLAQDRCPAEPRFGKSICGHDGKHIKAYFLVDEVGVHRVSEDEWYGSSWRDGAWRRLA